MALESEPWLERGAVQSQLGALLSGLLYPPLFAPFELRELAWIALVPLAATVSRSAPRHAAGAGLTFGFVATLGVTGWVIATVHHYFGFGVWSSAAFGAGVAIAAAAPFFALAFAAYACAAPRLPSVYRPLLFAAAWVSTEYARTELGLESPWAKLGDSQAESMWLRQIADVTGVYGVSGLLALANATAWEVLAALARPGSRWARARDVAWIGAPCAVLSIATCVYGARAVDRWSERPTLFEVALIQGNVPPELRWRRHTVSKVVQRYARLTRETLRTSDDRLALVVWPENAIQTPLSDPVYGRFVRGLARTTPALLLGAPRFEGAGSGLRSFNSAHLLRRDGSEEHYDKRRLVPFSETRPMAGFAGFAAVGDLDVGQFSRGDRPGMFSLPDARLGVLICMEALYPALGREASLAGADVLVNLSNDGWYRGRGGAEQHLAQVVFRAVETRRPLVRAATTGVSAIVGPDGRVRSRLGTDETGVLRAAVPRGAAELTIYARTGDLFAIGCAMTTLAAAGWSARPKRFPHRIGAAIRAARAG
jgi:apolipoprotein N-acyltransferase